MNRFLMPFFFLLVTLMASGPLHAGFYITGSVGDLTPIDKKTSHRGEITGGVGYAFPLLVKTELFYKYTEGPMVGAGARLNFFPLLNLNGGIIQRFKSDKTHNKNGTGFFFGPGVHFELIPIIDIFADLNYYNISSHEMAELAAGLRIHF